jgi:hypothetical protein
MVERGWFSFCFSFGVMILGGFLAFWEGVGGGFLLSHIYPRRVSCCVDLIRLI